MTFGEATDLLLEQDLDAEVQVLVVYVMGILKETYAPTIEMTCEQKGNWDKVTETNGGTGTLFFVVKHLDHNLFPNNQETDDLIARAWLTPELIKVVD